MKPTSLTVIVTIAISSSSFGLTVPDLNTTNKYCTLTLDAGTLHGYLHNETEAKGVAAETGMLIHTYECPGEQYPSDFTRCCPEKFQSLCCADDYFNQIEYSDSSIFVWLSIIVTCLCLALALLVVVCCFWSLCPLYTTCKPRHFGDESVAYQTDEEKEALNGSVGEEKKGTRSYDVEPMKVKPIADV